MPQQEERQNGTYEGNVFGKRISLLGAIVILLFTAVIVYRHWKLGVPPGLSPDASVAPFEQKDSL